MSEREEVHAYTVNRWDCPDCGEVYESDAEFSGEDKCDACGAEVVIL